MSLCHFRSVFLQDRWQELNVSVIQLTFSHRQCSTILLYTLHQDTALCFHTSLGGCMHDSAVLMHHTNVCLLNVTPELAFMESISIRLRGSLDESFNTQFRDLNEINYTFFMPKIFLKEQWEWQEWKDLGFQFTIVQWSAAVMLRYQSALGIKTKFTFS